LLELTATNPIYVGSAGANQERRGMSEANKQLAELWFEEVWNKGRREAIRELLAPDAVVYDAGEAVKGAEGFYHFFDRMRAAFSDIHFSVQDAIAEADKVCLRWSCTMRHTGDALGPRATHKDLQTTGMTIVHSRSTVNPWRRLTLRPARRAEEEQQSILHSAAFVRVGYG
jgi:predicted ester cyclase